LDPAGHSFDTDLFNLSKLIGQDDNNNKAMVKYFQEHRLLMHPMQQTVLTGQEATIGD